MENKDVYELIKIFEQSELASLELQRNDFQIKLKKESAFLRSHGDAGNAFRSNKIPPRESIDHEMESSTRADKVDEPGETIVSPIVGVFYAQGQPTADPFVQIGDSVKKGQPLCVIEAMKTMNEITASCDGTVVEILVKNEEIVEVNTPLFRIQQGN